MTTEVLVYNKSAIALAADSAATLTEGKIFKTNKIFMLSKHYPIGIVVYGNSQYMEVPWESIIKEYRKNELKDNKFDTLKEYFDDFIKFITNENNIFLQDINERTTNNITDDVEGLFYFIRQRILEDIKEEISVSEINVGRIKEITLKNITKYENYLADLELSPTITKTDIQELIEKHEKSIKETVKETFEKLPLPIKRDKLVKLAINAYVKETLPKQVSGIVIVGFGEKEIFPSHCEFQTVGKINDNFRIEPYEVTSVKFNKRGGIYPIGQREMVDRFMCGIDPDLRQLYSNTCSNIFKDYRRKLLGDYNNFRIRGQINKEMARYDEELMEKFDTVIDEFIHDYYINPITEIVTHLPKNELAEMAETLVNLTSFKRRVSTDAETVSGPIDVALISKDDGFVWIRRKQVLRLKVKSTVYGKLLS